MCEEVTSSVLHPGCAQYSVVLLCRSYSNIFLQCCTREEYLADSRTMPGCGAGAAVPEEEAVGRLSCSCLLRSAPSWPLDCVRLGCSTKWDLAGRPEGAAKALPVAPLVSLPAAKSSSSPPTPPLLVEASAYLSCVPEDGPAVEMLNGPCCCLMSVLLSGCLSSERRADRGLPPGALCCALLALVFSGVCRLSCDMCACSWWEPRQVPLLFASPLLRCAMSPLSSQKAGRPLVPVLLGPADLESGSGKPLLVSPAKDLELSSSFGVRTTSSSCHISQHSS